MAHDKYVSYKYCFIIFHSISDTERIEPTTTNTAY